MIPTVLSGDCYPCAVPDSADEIRTFKPDTYHCTSVEPEPFCIYLAVHEIHKLVAGTLSNLQLNLLCPAASLHPPPPPLLYLSPTPFLFLSLHSLLLLSLSSSLTPSSFLSKKSIREGLTKEDTMRTYNHGGGQFRSAVIMLVQDRISGLEPWANRRPGDILSPVSLVRMPGYGRRYSAWEQAFERMLFVGC